MVPKFRAASKDETLGQFVSHHMQTMSRRSLKLSSHYDVSENIRDEFDEGEAHPSVLERWGKHSVFRMWEEANGFRYLCGAVVAKRGELTKPAIEVFGGWEMDTYVSVMIDESERVDLASDASRYKMNETREFVTTTFMLVMQGILDRPERFVLARGIRTPRERMLNTPAVVTISLSQPVTRTIGASGLGGGWKMPEHDVRGHERHYKSGKVVWIDGHKRGDKNVQRKTTYRVIP